jgi:hypothetical protein
MLGYVDQHHGIRPDFGVIPDRDRAQDLRARSDVDMPPDLGGAAVSACQGHLLKYQAIRADRRSGMNDDAVRMRNHQSTANLGPEWNLGTGDRTPKAMP